MLCPLTYTWVVLTDPIRKIIDKAEKENGSPRISAKNVKLIDDMNISSLSNKQKMKLMVKLMRIKLDGMIKPIPKKL